jgi:hypothetical protein
MILDHLLEIAQKGTKQPLDLWWNDVKETTTNKLIPDLEKVEAKIVENTRAKTNMQELLAILKQERPNELDLAKQMSYVAEVFLEHPEKATEQTKQKVHEYVQEVKGMYSIAQSSQFHYESRQKLKSTMDENSQKEYDLKLLKHEGMIYCLEYYLALYKAIQDAPDEQAKRRYVESNQINLGFGDLPGLWPDFNKDEVLGKFIYLVLNDQVRNKMVAGYFDTKDVVMSIKMNCDKREVCEADYSNTDISQVVESFKQLILIIMDAYLVVGVDHLASVFFSPYGNKPAIKDVKKML